MKFLALILTLMTGSFSAEAATVMVRNQAGEVILKQKVRQIFSYASTVDRVTRKAFRAGMRDGKITEVLRNRSYIQGINGENEVKKDGHYFGWCCKVNDKPLTHSADIVVLRNGKETIEWYYGAAKPSGCIPAANL